MKRPDLHPDNQTKYSNFTGVKFSLFFVNTVEEGHEGKIKVQCMNNKMDGWYENIAQHTH